MYNNILQSVTNSLGTIPEMSEFNIVQPNESYTPTVREKYCRIHLLPATPTNIDKYMKQLTGLVQLDLYTNSEESLEPIVDIITNHFHSNPVTIENSQRVVINNVRMFRSDFKNNGWYKTIVFFSFEYYFMT